MPRIGSTLLAFIGSTLLAFLLLGVLMAPTSDAAVTRRKAIWGPLEVGGVSQFPMYASLGVGIYQADLTWSAVALRRPDHPQDPTDPAYSWPAELDFAVREGARYGIGVSVRVMGSPAWANGFRAPRWAPTNPSDYADFITASAKRYPGIRHWLIWTEPTKSENFQPLSADGGRRLRGYQLRGPRRYAQILDAAYGALKRVNPRNLVIGGNTFTVGTVSPLRWIQALRLPNGRAPRMDLYGHNPFSVRRPVLSKRPLGRGSADFGDLDTLTGWLDHYLKGSRPDGKKLRLFLSEYSLPTDHENFEFNFYVSRATQARWLKDALRVTRRWRRIYSLGYLGLYDSPLRPDNRQVEHGLLDREGGQKPAFEVFRQG